MFIYRPLARIHLFPAPTGEAIAQETEPLVFQLVETPDDAIRKRPEDARLFSDKDAIARDEYRSDDKQTGDAYSEGRTQYRIFAGQSEPAATGEEADARQRETAAPASAEPASPSQSPMPDENTEPLERSDVAAPEDYLKAQAARSALSMQRPFSDDIDFNQRRFSAENLGNISLSTYAWDYAYYILEMKRKLKDNIYPPAAFTQLGIISGEAVLRFKVLPNGTATDVTVVGYKGDRSFTQTSLDAVRLASPFRPLPPDFPDEFLELTWTFIYSVYR